MHRDPGGGVRDGVLRVNKSAMMTVHEIAHELCVSVSHARQNVVTRRGFPPARLLPGGRRRPPLRWIREEFEDWMHSLKQEKQ